jgi:O-antigen/teichoic acid export membrane protein
MPADEHIDGPNPIELDLTDTSGSLAAIELGQELRSEEAGRKVVRGSIIRAAGYGIGAISTLVGSIVLLRYLGAAQFGTYTAVMSITAIAGGISEAGLTAVGNREMSLLHTADERKRLTSQLLGLRLLLAPLAGVLSVLFVIATGYPHELVIGTAISSLGWILMAVSSSIAIPLTVDLRIGTFTALELIKQLSIPIFYVLLVIAGAGLVPFFGVVIPGAVVAIAITPFLVARGQLGAPEIDPRAWRDLIARSLPIAIAAVIGVIYMRLAVVLMFEFSTPVETGYFSTAARVIEAVNGLPMLTFMIALPVLTAHHKDDPGRMQLIFERMVEAGLLFACLLTTGLFLGAAPIIDLIGGSSYEGAIEALKVQSFSLIGMLFALSCLTAAIATDMRRAIIVANSFALAMLVVVGIPLITAGDANGAALALVIGDFSMAAAYYFMIGRPDRSRRPAVRPLWRPLLAGALALAAGSLVPFGDVGATLVGLAVFTAAAVAFDAIPGEFFDALGLPVPRAFIRGRQSG